MATINLTTWERSRLSRLIGSLRGNVAVVRLAVMALDKLLLSDDEKKEVSWADLPDGSAKWKDTEKSWDIEFPQNEWDIIVRAARESEDWEPSFLALNLLNKIIPEEKKGGA